MIDAQAVRRYAALAQIAHHVPGRIRLKLALGPIPPEVKSLATKMADAFARAPGIRDVSVNPLARSCVVSYDPEAISPTAWKDLIEGTGSPDGKALAEALASGA